MQYIVTVVVIIVAVVWWLAKGPPADIWFARLAKMQFPTTGPFWYGDNELTKNMCGFIVYTKSSGYLQHLTDNMRGILKRYYGLSIRVISDIHTSGRQIGEYHMTHRNYPDQMVKLIVTHSTGPTHEYFDGKLHQGYNFTFEKVRRSFTVT